MYNKVKIRRRGKLKYFATELPLQYRRPGEGRIELMAATRQDLSEKYEAEIERRKQGLDEDAGKMTLGQFLKKFLDFAKTEGGIEVQTWSDYRFHMNRHITPLLGDTALSRLAMRDVDHWIVALRQQTSERTKKPLSHRTIEYAYAVLC